MSGFLWQSCKPTVSGYDEDEEQEMKRSEAKNLKKKPHYKQVLQMFYEAMC